jgi:hypothetical protein
VATDFDVFVRKVEISANPEISGIVNYENLAPCVIGVPGYGASDWLLDYQNDFALFWNSTCNCMIHFAPENPSDKDWQALFLGNWSTWNFGTGVYFAIGADSRATKIHCGTVGPSIPNITFSSPSAGISLLLSVPSSFSCLLYLLFSPLTYLLSLLFSLLPALSYPTPLSSLFSTLPLLRLPSLAQLSLSFLTLRSLQSSLLCSAPQHSLRSDVHGCRWYKRRGAPKFGKSEVGRL